MAACRANKRNVAKIALAELARRSCADTEDAEQAAARSGDRHADHRVAGEIGQRDAVEVTVVVENDRLAGREHASDQPLVRLELGAELRLGQAVDGFDLHHVAPRLVQADRAVVGAEQAAGARDDAREQRAQLQLAGDFLQDRAERLAEVGRLVRGFRGRGRRRIGDFQPDRDRAGIHLRALRRHVACSIRCARPWFKRNGPKLTFVSRRFSRWMPRAPARSARAGR